MSNKLNKNLSVGVDFIFSSLHKKGHGERFIYMIKVDLHDTPISNLKLK